MTMVAVRKHFRLVTIHKLKSTLKMSNPCARNEKTIERTAIMGILILSFIA